jgi:hypothetical protein
MDKKWGDTTDEEDYVNDDAGPENEIPEDHVVTSISTQDVRFILLESFHNCLCNQTYHSEHVSLSLCILISLPRTVNR